MQIVHNATYAQVYSLTHNPLLNPHTHTDTHALIHTCMHTYMHVCIHIHTQHTHTHARTHTHKHRDNAHVHVLRQPSRLRGHQVELLCDGILGSQPRLQLLCKDRELSTVTLDYVSASDQLTSTDGTPLWPL